MLVGEVGGQLGSGVALEDDDALDLVFAQVDVHEEQRPELLICLEVNLLLVLGPVLVSAVLLLLRGEVGCAPSALLVTKVRWSQVLIEMLLLLLFCNLVHSLS